MIIAVDVMASWDTSPEIKDKTQVLLRALSIASRKLKKYNLRFADIVIVPDLAGMPLMNAKNNEKMFDAGISAARQSLPKIREILIKKGVIQ